MNLGSILGSISPAAGIASGGGLFGKLFHPHAGAGAGVPDPSQAGAAVPTPQPPAVQAPQPVAPPGPAAAPMGKQPGGPPVMRPLATPPAAPPEQTGGLHGVAFGGKPNMQGILAALQMMAPGGQRRF